MMSEAYSYLLKWFSWPFLLPGVERTGTDQNSTLKNGTDQASKMHVQDLSPLLLC